MRHEWDLGSMCDMSPPSRASFNRARQNPHGQGQGPSGGLDGPEGPRFAQGGAREKPKIEKAPEFALPVTH